MTERISEERRERLAALWKQMDAADRAIRAVQTDFDFGLIANDYDHAHLELAREALLDVQRAIIVELCAPDGER